MIIEQLNISDKLKLKLEIYLANVNLKEKDRKELLQIIDEITK